MVRYAHKAFVYVDTGRADKEECEDDSSNVWDPRRDLCFRLYRTLDKLEEVDKDTTDLLWGNDGQYNLDRLQTFRNAYACWVDNDGKVGKPDAPKNPSDSSPPSCFFGMKVVMGQHILGRGSSSANYIKLDKFAGQKEGDHWNDGLIDQEVDIDRNRPGH